MKILVINSITFKTPILQDEDTGNKVHLSDIRQQQSK